VLFLFHHDRVVPRFRRLRVYTNAAPDMHQPFLSRGGILNCFRALDPQF